MPKSDSVGERGDESPGPDTGTDLAAMVHGGYGSIMLGRCGTWFVQWEFRRACRRLLCADFLRPMSEGCGGTRAVGRHGDDACDGLYVNTPHAGSGSAREKALWRLHRPDVSSAAISGITQSNDLPGRRPA